MGNAEHTRRGPVSKISDRRTRGGGACIVVLDSAGRPPIGARYELGDENLTIGRSLDATIVIESEMVSRFHAQIEPQPDGFILVDCGSTNGTYVGDHSVQEHGLQSGDLIKIGPCILKYLAAGDIEVAHYVEIGRRTDTDGLTGVANRRIYDETIEIEVSRALRQVRPLSLAMFDLDHFKKVNDTHGHAAGDEVLKAVASIVQSRIRKSDVFARYGGEEFALVLPETPTAIAAQLAEQIRVAAGDTKIEHGQDLIRVTLSVGIAGLEELESKTGPVHELLKAAADKRLYEAKRNGRNRVVWKDGPADLTRNQTG